MAHRLVADLAISNGTVFVDAHRDELGLQTKHNLHKAAQHRSVHLDADWLLVFDRPTPSSTQGRPGYLSSSRTR